MKSSAWWPSAIFVAPTSFAIRYSTPRRSRAHSEHGVWSSSRMSSISSPMPVCSMRYSQPRARQVLRDELVLVFLVAGVDVDRDQREADRRALPQHVEDLQQRPAVLAARQPDHDAVAVLDHVDSRRSPSSSSWRGAPRARCDRPCEILISSRGWRTDRYIASRRHAPERRPRRPGRNVVANDRAGADDRARRRS